ncbi:hypothetical protein Tco_1321658 [Tanacetum coccineum]
MAFDLRLTEDILPWPGNANMAFDLRATEDVLPWPGNANMVFDLRRTENVLPWPGNANMAFDLQRTENVLPWPGNVTNGSCLDDGRLFTDFNVGAARQMSLSAEVRMRAEYNIKEKRRLKSVVDKQKELLKVREREIKNLKAQLLLREAEAAEAIRLRAEASKFEAVEKSLQDEMKALKERNTTLEREKNYLDVKVTDLAASVAVREREVADLDALLEVSSFELQEKVAVYEDCMGPLEKFQDDRMKEVNDKFYKLYTDFIDHGG